MNRAVGTLLTFAVLASACASSATVIDIDADDRVRREIGSLAITVRSGDQREPRYFHIIDRSDLSWPTTLTLHYEQDRTFRVKVEAYSLAGGRGDLVSSRFLRGDHTERLVGYFRLSLDELCEAVLCDEARDETCFFGNCVTGDRGASREEYVPLEDPR